MAPSIGVNLRVTGHCSQGGRKYMEDMFSVAYQQTEDEKDLEYAYFGIFDGHGGCEAATFAKEHLMDYIVNHKGFWSDKDEDIQRAIRDGFLQTHLSMWGQLESWPKTASGLPSTSGTTASVAFIRKGKIYIGHVGDSSIVLGYQEEGDNVWKGKPLTRDHKPESKDETARIEQSGGKVVSKSGVPRVVWNRPRLGHKGPVRRSTHIDEIPFLAVARSLGDLWSYNSELDQFVVSPEPDVGVVTVDVGHHRCLIFGTDGLWNMLTPNTAVAIVQAAETHNEKHVLQQSDRNHVWINPSKSLVDRALECWSATRLRADNTSVVTLMLDPPGPPRAQVLLGQKKQQKDELTTLVPYVSSSAFVCRLGCRSQPAEEIIKSKQACYITKDSGNSYDPKGGVAIFTRYPVNGNSANNSCPDSSSNHSKAVQINEVSSSSSMEDSSALAPKVIRQQSFNFGSENSRCSVGSKRRHSSIANLLDENTKGSVSMHYEPCPKRRTRSEDKRLCAPPADDDMNMSSDVENERVSWPNQWRCEDESDRMHRRRSIEKRITQGPSGGKLKLGLLVSRASVRKSEMREENTTRMLRSDTAAALPVRTLRSRNINILEQSKKAQRHSMPSRLASNSSTSNGRHRASCWGGIMKPKTSQQNRKHFTK